MKIVLKFFATAFSLFLLTVAIYWFNLDTKVVKFAEPYLTKWYDHLERDKRL